MLNRVMIKII